jgi:hypothetical protein
LPAVAERYSAIRGELFEPGGCSDWPTSAEAICTMRCPGPPEPTALTAPVAVGAIALWRADAKLAPDDGVEAGMLCGGAKAVSSA